MAPIKEAVYATLLMDDSYLPGAMVLGHSLKDKGAKARLVVLATIDNLSASTITELRTVYDEIIPVNRIVNKHPANLYLMDRPDLISTFTKIELWRQTQFRQIVYIDADMVAIRAPNELLNYNTNFAAVPDIGWPDCFNSGLLVLRPNLGDYYSLLALAQRGISFDGADQGLLNMHFQDWERLSFAYNCTPSGSYQYIPAYKHFQSSISLLHFIGREKPWTIGRDHKYASGVYGELLGRWWSTYDKHYRVHASYQTGRPRDTPRTVPNYVTGEKTTSYLGYSFSEPQPQHEPAPWIDVEPPPEAPATTTEEAMGDQPEPVEQIDKQDFEPTSTVEQRRFTAPQMEWDASRAPPPMDSKPEAQNFPSQVYEFNQDTSLFQAPKYPEAPRDMYYQVPSKPKRTEKPKPIFPWEAHAPKPTRVFPEERPPSPEPEIEPEPEPEPEPEAVAVARTSSDASESSVFTRESRSSSNSASESDPWNSYTRVNAWDAMPEIERYVQAFVQSRKGKVQVLHQAGAHSKTADQSLLSPPVDAERRPSMKITDFPTEWERPSLPVTPAPRHPSFWGEEGDEEGELPAAEGVPKQQDWNPVQKLEELQKRQTEVLQTGPELIPKEIPNRAMPDSAVDTTAVTAEATAKALCGEKARATDPATERLSDSGVDMANARSRAQPKPILKEPSFELGGVSSEKDLWSSKDVAPEVLSANGSASAWVKH
ncbi:hypothetical protein GJ744_011670 [Endocarpon pusillum]|uniref:glycogenin glucosyltransferase n=1 Tax=Endocarpon pusillum TaxID=364733 RepID=A0A8H7AFK5_9EURO|nr:hypothetical protein GJ744_011670 [Endocarpon pusillum]